jgi:hypothetical protein
MTMNGGIGLFIKAVILLLTQSTITNGLQCKTLTESSTPTIASVCTGGSYTGALKKDAEVEECSGSSCSAEDANLCCESEGTCCSAGQFLSVEGKTCVDCPAGTVARQSDDGMLSCHFCNPCINAYSEQKSTQCNICGANPGEYWHLVMFVDEPTDSGPTDSGPTDTELGDTGSGSGGKGRQLKGGAGSTPVLRGTCLRCPTGTFKQAMDTLFKYTLTHQTAVPSGLTLVNNDNIKDAGSCALVHIQESLAKSQEPCAYCVADMGSYSNEFGQSECKQCASGKTVKTETNQACMMDEQDFLAYERTAHPDTGAELCGDCDTFTAMCTDEKYCTDCPTGTAGEDGRCDPCEVGRYINVEGQTTCLECPVGEYQDQSSQTECKKCIVGTMSNVAGGKNITQCRTCLSGQYQAAKGQASCVGCPDGYSQPESGETACVPCVAGTHGPSTGLEKW